MFVVLRSKYRREKIKLLGKIDQLRDRLEDLGKDKVKVNENYNKLVDENRELKQKLKKKNSEGRELKLKLNDVDERLKTKVEEKTKEYSDKLQRMQSGYDKLIFELDELKHR